MSHTTVEYEEGVADEPLRFGVSSGRRPQLNGVRVFDTLDATVMGERFRFRIIGASHFISAPDSGFHEVASCKPVPDEIESSQVVELDSDDPEPLVYEGDEYACRIEVELRDLAAFPESDDFDLRYDFAPNACTAIRLVECGYETYHTYPEHDLTVYTRTRFDRLGE